MAKRRALSQEDKDIRSAVSGFARDAVKRVKDGAAVTSAVVAAYNAAGLAGEAGRLGSRVKAELSRALQSGKSHDDALEAAEAIISRHGVEVEETAPESPAE
jgi:hypothetical protein